jgi:hypothetical protein
LNIERKERKVYLYSLNREPHYHTKEHVAWGKAGQVGITYIQLPVRLHSPDPFKRNKINKKTPFHLLLIQEVISEKYSKTNRHLFFSKKPGKYYAFIIST